MSFHQEKEAGDLELIEAINDEAGELINLLRCSHAPDEVLADAADHIRAAMEALAPYLQQGEGWSTISIASDTPGMGWMEDDLTRCMPYSPISGRRNPVAPPIRMWRDGDEVRGEALFSPTYAGPPATVHGGIIAAVFDEMLSMANPDIGPPTERLKISDVVQSEEAALQRPLLWSLTCRRRQPTDLC